jgi:hypothetical protein
MHPKRSCSALAVVVAVVLSCPAPARADLIFTDQPTFLSNVQSGYFLENFDSLPSFNSIPSPSTFSGGSGFSYSASAPIALFGITPNLSDPTNHALSTSARGDTITITFTGAAVTAVGGNFFGTDFNGHYTSGQITAKLSDGTTDTLSNPTLTSFAGFITDSAIVSLQIFTTGATFPTVDNLIVGAASVASVPEPSTLVLAGLGGLGFLAYGFRSRRRAG